MHKGKRHSQKMEEGNTHTVQNGRRNRTLNSIQNHRKNESNPNHRLNPQQAIIVDENHGYFTYTSEIVPLRLLFQLAACTKPKENPDQCVR